MGYSKSIIRGFSWAAILNAIAMAVSFVKIVLLSHFIFGPAEFGIFGVGVVVLGVLELITETGINVFLIQETEPLATYLDTAWVVSIIRGFLIAIILGILAYPISVFYKIPSHWTFILAFSLLPLIRGFLNPAIANLQKNLKFREDSIYRFLISVVGDFAIIIFAFTTHSLFSFVIGMMASAIVELILTFVFIKEKPSFSFDMKHVRKIINRGRWVTLALIFDYLFEHGDDLAVGKILNVASLGIYQNSYNIAILPEKAIGQQLGKVTFPVYIKFLDDKLRLRRAFSRTFFVTLLLVLPFGAALFFLSDPIIKLVLGNKWLAAIPVLRVLALFAVARVISSLFHPLFLAFKKQRYITISTLVSILVLAISVVPFTKIYGISGAALAALIGSIAGIPVDFYYFYKLTNINEKLHTG
jgi:O-antigen/teichoic acid export membrane protein